MTGKEDLYTDHWEPSYKKEPNLTDLPDDSNKLEFDYMEEDEDQLMEFIDKQLAEAHFNSTDYYAIFNLSKESTSDEIKEAYKRLCRTFHPDKHTDPAKRMLAQERFQVLGKAYDVLSDPNKRAIYDNYGEKALTMPWTVGPLLKTPEQLREEYERMARRKREEQLENLVQTKTAFQAQIDATSLFANHPELRSFKRRIDRVQVSRLLMKHSYQTQLTNNLNLSITGNVVAQGGRGGGNVGANIRHSVSPQLTLEYGMSLLKSRVGTFKASYQPTSSSFVNTHSTVVSPWVIPNTSITVGRQIASNITGFMSYSTGDWGTKNRNPAFSSLSVGLASNTRSVEYQGELQVGPMQSLLTGRYKHTISTRTKLVVTGTLSNVAGAMVGLGAEHRIVEKTKVMGLVDFGYPSGIALRLSLSRLGQTLSIPIGLSQELSLSSVLFATLVPVGVCLLSNEFIVVPWRTRRLNEKLREIKELNKEYLMARKQEAEDACELLRESVNRKSELEDQKNGLVITQALYGKFDKEFPRASGECADVTIPVQNLVYESQLHIVGGHSKSKILGFYDPCFGSTKRLLVRYRFNRKEHTVVVDDKVSLICPMRSHIVSN